jgi:catechol 2,3-dioxygenase-like lactoylglutathione lyase family enzyme
MRMVSAVALAAALGAAAGGVMAQGKDVAKAPRLFRVILPVADMAEAEAFYTRLLGVQGRRVAPQRHYFDAGEVILALVDPRGPEGAADVRPNQEYLYFAVSDLEQFHARAAELGVLDREMGTIARRPWGERSFYAHDPFGNPICFVDEKTLFTGR